MDLIQRTLDEQANAAASVTNDGNSVTGKKRKAMPNNGNGTPDRLKASNFPAKRLTIGDWSVRNSAFDTIFFFYSLFDPLYKGSQFALHL